MKIDRNFQENEMIKEISVKEFVDSGALWFVNQTLHLFGMALSYNPDTYEKIIPNICRFRGFDEKSNSKGYEKLNEYLKDNIEELEKDCELE